MKKTQFHTFWPSYSYLMILIVGYMCNVMAQFNNTQTLAQIKLNRIMSDNGEVQVLMANSFGDFDKFTIRYTTETGLFFRIAKLKRTVSKSEIRDWDQEQILTYLISIGFTIESQKFRIK